MSKREVKAAMCDGKVAFDGFMAAQRSSRHKGTRPYRCPFCQQWHVGGVEGFARTNWSKGAKGAKP